MVISLRVESEGAELASSILPLCFMRVREIGADMSGNMGAEGTRRHA